MTDWATNVRITQEPSRDEAFALLQDAGLPTSDLTPAHMEHFFILGFDGAAIGLVELELYGRDALLRSLVVASQRRKCALGSILLAPRRRTREFADICQRSSALLVKQLKMEPI
jgi:hypothetical protein